MGGKVSVKSVLGKGTRFILTLSLPAIDTLVLSSESSTMSSYEKRKALL